MEYSLVLETLIPAQLLINSTLGYIIYLRLPNILHRKLKLILLAILTAQDYLRMQ